MSAQNTRARPRERWSAMAVMPPDRSQPSKAISEEREEARTRPAADVEQPPPPVPVAARQSVQLAKPRSVVIAGSQRVVDARELVVGLLGGRVALVHARGTRSPLGFVSREIVGARRGGP